MVSGSSTRTTSSTRDASSSGGRTLVPRPGIIRRPGGPPKVTEPTVSTATIRTRRAALAEVAGAAHQGAGGAGADEQHVELGELAGDRRGGAPVVRLPVVRVAVLVEPHVPVVGGAQRADVVEPRAEEPADRVRLGDDVHLGAERLHQPPGGQVAAGVGDAQEPVALAGRDHAQRDAEVPGRGLDQDRTRGQDAVSLGGLHHLGGGLELDRAGEVEPFAFQVERAPEDRAQVDVELFVVELVRTRNDGHDVLQCVAAQPW